MSSGKRFCDFSPVLREKVKGPGRSTGTGPFKNVFAGGSEVQCRARDDGTDVLYPLMQTESRSLGKWFSASPVPSALTATMFSILTPNLPGR